MHSMVILIIEFLSVFIVISFITIVGYAVYGMYRRGNNVATKQHRPSEQLQIDYDDIVTSVITVSQQARDLDIDELIINNRGSRHNRRRSQSDPDIISDRVTLQIESPQKEKLKSRILSMAESIESTDDSLSALFDEESDSPFSPLSSPVSAVAAQYNQDIELKTLSSHKQHRRRKKKGMLTSEIIHDAISDSECLSFNDINAIINTIEDESDSADNEEEEEDDFDITRMIVGSDARIISDGPVSTPTSLQSTNFSMETNDTQYSGFMAIRHKGNQCEKIEEKCLEEDEEKGIVHNAEVDRDEDALSITATYSNSIQDLNMIHGIKSVGIRPRGNQEEHKEDLMRKEDLPPLKNKISEYQQNIKNLEQSGNTKTRRSSVAQLELNRLVKNKRTLFENNRMIAIN